MNKRGILFVILVVLLLGILFPFATMTKFSCEYAAAFNFIFDSLLSHILMHAALFAGLTSVVMILFQKRSFVMRLWLALVSLLVVALGQEAIQMISTGTSDFGAAFFDLGIDLAGGSIPLAVYWINESKKLPKKGLEERRHVG